MSTLQRLRRRRKRYTLAGCALIAGLVALAGVMFYNLPFVRDRLDWRIALWTEQARGLFAPPQAQVLPTLATTRAAPPTLVIAAATPSPSPTLPQSTPQPTFTPTITPTPIVLPSTAKLTGARWEPQLLNNCGPATLTAALVFWGWRGAEADSLNWYGNGVDVRWQKDVAAAIKPAHTDKNVSAFELAAFAREQAGLGAVVRYGGDLERVKVLVANGFPVILERAFLEDEHEQAGQGWEGHYSLVTGFDEATQEFTTQDSFKGGNYRRSYEAIALDWRAFNYLYLVLYAPEREGEVLTHLGTDANEQANLINALVLAQGETQALTDPEQLAFAWHNAGVSLQHLGRAAEAVAAFDQARSYTTLPWRMLWYQHEMYAAYFAEGRYQDILDLATALLVKPGLEESYYWRARTHYALGNTADAVSDLRAALTEHPDWEPALAQLREWGLTQ
jgi:tetratricopeptide (TPR) repeat protein